MSEPTTNDELQDDSLMYDGFSEIIGEVGAAIGDGCTGYEPGAIKATRRKRYKAYFTSQLVRNAVEVLATTSLNTFQGWKRDKGEKEMDELTERLSRWFKSVAYLNVLDALHLGRLDGVSYLLVCSTDTLDPLTPFNFNKKSRITKLIPLGESEVTDPGAGHLEYAYWITPNLRQFRQIDEVWPIATASQTFKVHPSRIIEVPGLRVPDALYDKMQNRLGRNREAPHQSILDSLLPALTGWVNANTSAIQMLESHSAFTLGIENMAIKSKRDEGKGLKKRLTAAISSIKSLKGLSYDATTEKAELISRSYTGVDSLIQSLADYLDASSDTPYEFLLYNSKAFESATGGARQALAQRVAEYQCSHLQPILERLLFMYLSSIGEGDEVDNYTPIFSDGRILTAKEKAETEFKSAQKDALLVNAQIIRRDNPRLMREWEEDNPVTPEELAEAVTPTGAKISKGKQSAAKKTPTKKPDKRNPVGNALKSKQGREESNGHEVS